MQSRFIVKYADKHCLMNKERERERNRNGCIIEYACDTDFIVKTSQLIKQNKMPASESVESMRGKFTKMEAIFMSLSSNLQFIDPEQ